MQNFKISITMRVDSLVINQGENLTEEEQKLVLSDFLSNQIYFPIYSTEGEINGKIFEIQFIFDKKSPQLIDLIKKND